MLFPVENPTAKVGSKAAESQSQADTSCCAPLPAGLKPRPRCSGALRTAGSHSKNVSQSKLMFSREARERKPPHPPTPGPQHLLEPKDTLKAAGRALSTLTPAFQLRKHRKSHQGHTPHQACRPFRFQRPAEISAHIYP